MLKLEADWYLSFKATVIQTLNADRACVWSSVHHKTIKIIKTLNSSRSGRTLIMWHECRSQKAMICFHQPKHTEVWKYIGDGGLGGEGRLTLDTMTLTTRKTLVTRVVTCGGREERLDVCYNSRPDVLIKRLFHCFICLCAFDWLEFTHSPQ